MADMAGVSRAAVSNWRKRDEEFPGRVSGSASKPLFSREDAVAYLRARGYSPSEGDARLAVWSAMNLLRGKVTTEESVELLLAVAVEQMTGGDTRPLRTQVPAELVENMTKVLATVPPEELADVTDFALERLARAQVKMGADFGFVGSRTTKLLANLAAARGPKTLYDPACGIAAALLATVGLGAKPERLIGHDVNKRALTIAAQRAALQDVDLELTCTDVVGEDVDPDLRADTIIAEPPFGLRLTNADRLTDRRFVAGPPPATSADMAWLQHVIAHLTDEGRGYVVTPNGPLFRGGQERAIRTELVRRGCVEAIVALPGKLLPHTALPLAVWVLRRPAETQADGAVLFIDATKEAEPEDSVAKWLNDPSSLNCVPNRVVPVADVLAGDAALQPARWVEPETPEPAEIARRYSSGWRIIDHEIQELRDAGSSAAPVANFPAARVMTIGELIDQAVLEVRAGQAKHKLDEFPADLRSRVVTATDLRMNALPTHDKAVDHPDLTQPGDILVNTNSVIRARVDASGGNLPAAGLHRVRVLASDALAAEYLCAVLAGPWNDRFGGGSTVQRARLLDLEIPMLPLADQRGAVDVLLNLSELQSRANSLADGASNTATALLEALRYGASLPDTPTGDVGDGHHNAEKTKKGIK